MVQIKLSKKNKVTIILTMTIRINPNVHWLEQRDSTKRLQIYLTSIVQWLEKTNLNICIIENSGYMFYELDEYKEKYKDRFEIISYDEKTYEGTLHLKYSVSKGQCELYALKYAYEHSKLIMKSYFIIKITGRYFIPGFENYLNGLDLTKYDVMQQNDNARCELVGVSDRYFNIIFNTSMKSFDGSYFMPHMESYICYRVGYSILKHKKINCPLFEIEPTLNGGQNEPYTTI